MQGEWRLLSPRARIDKAARFRAAARKAAAMGFAVKARRRYKACVNTKTITQTVTLPARPAAVYAALLDEKQHAAFTGNGAQIAPHVGGAFTCYDGYITGVTVELVPAKLIVQAWRSKGWPKGFYSLVTFALSAHGRGKTKLRFTQLGVPAGDFKAKSSGWRTHYWEPLQRFLARSK
jgi:activator of HSP90 ATPase